MQRWGHQQGQGLGKHGDGIVHALKAENIDTQKKASKSGWVQASSSKGKLVNLNPDRKKEADLLKYGEPSQIVCLTNVLAHPDLADEELQVEIGQECEKNGTVERVVMHVIDQADLVQVGQDGSPPDPSDAFRIFIVFKSIPGAWKTVTEMDGRFFGGRQIVSGVDLLVLYESILMVWILGSKHRGRLISVSIDSTEAIDLGRYCRVVCVACWLGPPSSIALSPHVYINPATLSIESFIDRPFLHSSWPLDLSRTSRKRDVCAMK